MVPWTHKEETGHIGTMWECATFTFLRMLKGTAMCDGVRVTGPGTKDLFAPPVGGTGWSDHQDWLCRVAVRAYTLAKHDNYRLSQCVPLDIMTGNAGNTHCTIFVPLFAHDFGTILLFWGSYFFFIKCTLIVHFTLCRVHRVTTWLGPYDHFLINEWMKIRLWNPDHVPRQCVTWQCDVLHGTWRVKWRVKEIWTELLFK